LNGKSLGRGGKRERERERERERGAVISKMIFREKPPLKGHLVFIADKVERTLLRVLLAFVRSTFLHRFSKREKSTTWLLYLNKNANV